MFSKLNTKEERQSFPRALYCCRINSNYSFGLITRKSSSNVRIRFTPCATIAATKRASCTLAPDTSYVTTNCRHSSYMDGVSGSKGNPVLQFASRLYDLMTCIARIHERQQHVSIDQINYDYRSSSYIPMPEPLNQVCPCEVGFRERGLYPDVRFCYCFRFRLSG